MNFKRTIPILTALGILTVILLGLAAFQSMDAQAAGAQTETMLDSRFHGFGRDNGEYLAEALGISEEELQAAYERANEAAINQAVDAGLITQAQADAMNARGALMPFGGRFTPWLAENGIDFEALLAEELDITVEELQAAQAEAADLRLDATVESGELTQEEADLIRARQALIESESFQSTMRAALENAVSQAVESGLLSQAQADLILERLAEFDGFGGIGGFFGPGGFHGHGGFHGPGGPGGPVIPETPSSTTPTTST